MKDRIKKANDIMKPHMAIRVLNPIRWAIFTPKDSTEFVAIPKIGNTIYRVDCVTLGSLLFMYAAQ